MKNLDRETQIIAVEKVLEEMKTTEEHLSKQGACWMEQCLDARIKTDMNYILDIQNKYNDYYVLEKIDRYDQSEDLPLRKAVLEGLYDEEYLCEFDRILWGMKSNKSRKNFSFKNNGEIKYSKSHPSDPTVKHPKSISYETSYNVLSDDVMIDIIIYEYVEGLKNSKTKHMFMSLNGNILTRKYNGIEIILDVSTGVKKVQAIGDNNKGRNHPSVFFEARFNEDKIMEYGALEIRTHKGNGKVNGTYRLDASLKKGIRARFISRKGINVDLNANPMLANNANTLLLPILNLQNNEAMVISDFANSTKKAIAQSLSDRVILFDSSDFNFTTIQETEKYFTNTIKEIKGELPLNGLVERINKCLDSIDREKNLQIENSPKALRLENNN